MARGVALLALAALLLGADSVSIRKRSRRGQRTSATSLSHRTIELESVGDYSFKDYLRDFGKHYDNASEYERREVLFNQRVGEIVAHNLREKEGLHTHRLGVNKFADVSDEEFDRLHKGYSSNVGGVSSLLQEGGDRVEGRGREHEWACENGEVVTCDLGQDCASLCPDGRHGGGSASLLEEDAGYPDRNGKPKKIKPVEELPEAVDWTKEMTTPKDQGGCGSCWAFAATAVMEGHLHINTGKTFDLSEQSVVDCTPNEKECGGKGGCDGATSELAFDYIANNGIRHEKDHRYKHKTNTCPSGWVNERKNMKWVSKPTPAGAATIDRYVNIPPNDYKALMNAIAYEGPLTISVDATGWSTYSKGVYSTPSVWKNPDSTSDIDHAVSLVGYGKDADSGLLYWKVRNSWGPFWGEDGYIRIERSPEDDSESRCRMDYKPCDGIACKGECDTPVKVCGTAGILYCSSYPVNARSLGGKSSGAAGGVSTEAEPQISPKENKLIKELNSALAVLEKVVTDNAEKTITADLLESAFKEKTGKDLVKEIIRCYQQLDNAQDVLAKQINRFPSLKAAGIISMLKTDVIAQLG